MQNSPISFDLSKYLRGLEKRLSVVENRRPGTMYITEKIVTVDPETGVETIIGDLSEYGEDRNGIKQWVNDTEPPPVPSAPIVSSNLGTISVTWDGGNVNNVPQAPDFKHITVYAHAEGSTRDVGTVRSANESIILPDPPYNVVHTFTFKSVDFNGNESAPSMMSAEVMATPLVEAPDITAILEDINERYDGVITDSLQLNDKLAEARTDIDSAQESLLDLETVRLPQVEANIEAAHQEIITTGAELDARLDQAETDLNAAEAGLNTLKNTDLPAMKAQIEGVHQELVTTGGQLDSRLDQAEIDLSNAEAGLQTLETVTLPALNQRLADAETEINETGVELGNRLNKAETDLTGHNTRISSNESKITTLNNTTLPGLSADLSGAKTRLTAAEGEIATAKGKLSTAEGTLNTLKNTTIPALNTEVAGAKTRLTATETEVTNAKTRIGKTETDLTSAFGQITAVDTKAGNAQTAASNAQTAADSANAFAQEQVALLVARGQNLVRNGDFEAGQVGWNASGNSEVKSVNARSGSKSMNITAPSVNVWPTSDWVPSGPGRTYYVEYYIREGGTPDTSGSVGAVAQVKTAAGGTASFTFAQTASSAIPNFVFTKVSGTITPGTEDIVAIRFAPWVQGPTSSSYDIDDFLAVDVTEAQEALKAAATAQSRADSAHTAAGTAQSTADNALTMAGSKSKVYYSTSNPSGTASVGDTWRKVNASQDVIAEWRWTAGNTWVSQQITSEVISNLDVGKLTAGSAIINTAVVNKIAIQTADVIKLNASAITAGTISADRLNVTDLAAKIATVIQLNADRITAGTIDTGRLNATEVAAAVANVIQLNASRITAGTINTDRLNANEIAAKVATVIQLNASRITAGTISTDRLDVNDIAAKTASFQKVDVKNLFATTGTFSEAVIEKLWADVIRARKITTDQLLVGSGSNLIVDPYFEDETTKAARATLSNMSGYYGRNSTNNLNWFGGTQTAGTVQTYYFSDTVSRINTSAMIPIVEGSKYRFKFRYNSISGGARPVASIVRKDGTSGVTASGFTVNGVASSGFGGAGSGQIMEAVWAPDPSWDYAYFVPGIQWEATVTSAHIYGGASVQDMADGNLIVSGSIDADKINTNSVVAEVAKFIELDVSKLKVTAGATMKEAVIEKLWTDVVRSKKITTDQLLVGQGENLIPWDMVSTLDSARDNISGYGSGSVKPTLQKGAGVADGDHLFMVADWVNPGSNTITWQLSNGSTAGGYSNRWTVEPEEELVFSAYVRAGGSYTSGMPGIRVAIYWYSATGSNIANISTSATPLTWSWQKLTIDGKAPATAAYALVYIRQDQPGGIRVDLPSLYRKKGASLIVDGSIAAKQIDSESVSAEVAKFIDLDVSRLVATSATMNTAVVNKLWADVVRARKITTDMMIVGSGGNHFPDPLFTDPDGWSYSDRFVNSAGRNGGKGLVVPASTGQSGMYYGSSDRLRQMPVIGGQEYRVGVWVKSSVTIPVDKITIYVKYTTPSSTTSGSFATNIRNTGVDGRLGAVPANTWRFLEGITKMPDTAEQAFIGLYAESGFNAAVTFSEPSVQTAAGTGLIVENGIQAKHIEASESMSAKIGEFLKLDVRDLVTTGTAKMSDAVITKLWSDVVMSKKITADMMVIGGTNNLIPNANVLTDLAGWEPSTANVRRTVGASGPDATTPYMYATDRGNIRSTDFEVAGGNKFRFQIKAQANVTGTRFFVQLNNNGTGNPYIINNQALTTSWVTYSGEVELPEDATKASINIYVNHTNGGLTTQRFAFMSLIQMASGELIVDGAITAGKIKANSIESDKIKANAITADKIEAGAIKAEHIAVREITADKLRVGQGSNVFPDPLMKDTAGWPSSSTTVYTGGYGSSNRVRVTATSGQTGGYYGNGSDDVRRFPVVPGRSYVVSVWIRPTVNISIDSVMGVYTRLVKETGAGFVFTSPGIVSNDFQTTGYGLNPTTNKRTGAIPASTWVKMEGMVSVPSDSEYSFMIPGLYLQSGFPTGSSCDFSNLNISEAVTGELIVEGSITTDKLKAGAITADKLDSAAITGKTITGGTITGAEIVGSRYQFNGAGSGNGYNLRIENDAIGAYLGFSVPNGIVQGTIRAFDDDPWADYSTPTLVIRPPSVSGKADRDAVKISAGIDGGSGGLMDVGGNLWVRGELRARYQDANDVGRWTSIAINDVTSNYTGESPTIKSLGLYNRAYTFSSNMYVTSNGYIGRTTSLRASKLVIEDVPQEQIEALLNVNARWWFDKGDSERLASYLTALEAGADAEELEDIPEDLTRIPGLVAEEVEEAGATAFVTYDRDELGNKKLSGVNYDRIGPALIPLVRGHRDRITALESLVESQQQIIDNLSLRLATLESGIS